MAIRLTNNKKWLDKYLENEECGIVSVVSDLNQQAESEVQDQKFATGDVLGLLVEYSRRNQRMSIIDLAQKSGLDIEEVLSIEKETNKKPTPRVIYKIAQALNLPCGGLMELAGLMERRDEELSKAAVKFAACSEPSAALSKNERNALQEFVGVLAKFSGGNV